jgi:hypothetical protein
VTSSAATPRARRCGGDLGRSVGVGRHGKCQPASGEPPL